MNPRNTGILFLVAAALGAFIWFYEIRGEPGRKEAEAQAKRLFPGLSAEDVESIELTTSDGRAARLERRDGAWHLTAPLDAAADEFAAGGMASALAGAASESVLEDPQPAAVYGLDDPTHELAFTAKGERRTLRLGKKSPVGSKTYAAVGGDTRVVTVATFSVNALQKSLDDLREKRVARFEREAVRKIAASWPGGRVVLVKSEDAWRLVEPFDAAADSRTVDDLLSDLSFLRASGFEDAPPPDAQAGLSPPDFALELELAPAAGTEGAEPRRLSLAIGQARAGNERLVRGAGPSLYRIPAERISDFPRRVVEYRFRELARFDSFDAQRLEITFEDRESLRVEAKSGDAGWSSEPEHLDPAKLSSMVRELSSLRARDILAESAGASELAAFGLEPPRVTFRVFGKAPDSKPDAAAADHLLGEVQIGISRGADGVVARRPGVETVFLLDPAVAEQIPTGLEALRSHFLAPEKVDEKAEAPEADDSP